MKQQIKKTLKSIVLKGYFNFLAGNFTLKFYNKLEIKKIPLIREVLYSYYQEQIEKNNIEFSQSDDKPRVFFLTNIFPLWNKSTSNFLKVNADIAHVYIKNNIEVNIILANHSHLSYLTNKEIKWANIMDIDYKKIKEKIYIDLYNMYGITKDSVNIYILNQQRGSIKLKNYIQDVIAFFNNLKLTKKDIIFFSGGKCKSDVFQILISKIHAKRIYLTTSLTEDVKCENYDFVLTLNKKLLKKYKNTIFPITVNFSPFKWEEDEKISIAEKNIIQTIEKDKIIFVSSKQRYAKSIDDEFIDILNTIMLKYNEAILILIGDSKKNIFSKLKNKIKFNSNRVICIEFIDSLYLFFKELNNNFNTLFILPRITGNGVSNLMSACAKVPTTIFKFNDAEGKWIPSKYFIETKEEFINQINKFIQDGKKREEFINDFEYFKKEKRNTGEKFFLGLLK